MSFDYCQGFLDALALLNSEASDLCASYEIVRLPDAPDLATALGLRVEDHALSQISPSRELSAPLWQIATTPMPRAQLQQVCQRWFFSSQHMQAAPAGQFRANLAAAFLEALGQALYGFDAHSVTMAPPMWYAIHWDEIAFVRGTERYLLHFSHSD